MHKQAIKLRSMFGGVADTNTLAGLHRFLNQYGITIKPYAKAAYQQGFSDHCTKRATGLEQPAPTNMAALQGAAKAQVVPGVPRPPSRLGQLGGRVLDGVMQATPVLRGLSSAAYGAQQLGTVLGQATSGIKNPFRS